MALIVQKFGGSSVKDRDRIFNVARIVANTHNAGNDVVVVVSAQGDTTDDLIAKAGEITHNPSAREMDMLLATGEQISISLLAMALNELGCHAISLTGWQAGFRTDRAYTKARITRLETERISSELERNRVVVVAGFQGLNKLDDITTLGRGGSDATAVALAGAMHADMCEIFTDVDGVYSADPRVVKNAHKMKEITNTEMLEMARLGAGVMQPRSVELGMKYHIPIHVRSTFTNDEGTIIREVCMEGLNEAVRGVAQDAHAARIAVLGLRNVPGVAYSVFSALAEDNITVDMIVQSVRNSNDDKTDIVFTIDDTDMEDAKRVLDKMRDDGKVEEVIYDDDTAKVSVVGAGMLGKPGVAARMFGALGRAGVNIDIVSTSEISISCLILRKDLNKAVQAIHDEFFPQDEK